MSRFFWEQLVAALTMRVCLAAAAAGAVVELSLPLLLVAFYFGALAMVIPLPERR